MINPLYSMSLVFDGFCHVYGKSLSLSVAIIIGDYYVSNVTESALLDIVTVYSDYFPSTSGFSP